MDAAGSPSRLFCFGELLLVGIDHLNAPRGTTTLNRPRLGELVLPLFSLIVLFVPFLPVIPDWWPALQALSGPLGAIVWLVVAALQVWTLWQSRLITAQPSSDGASIDRDRDLRRDAGVAGLAAQKLTARHSSVVARPHYLVIAQSPGRDGDPEDRTITTRRLSQYFTLGPRASLLDARQPTAKSIRSTRSASP